VKNVTKKLAIVCIIFTAPLFVFAQHLFEKHSSVVECSETKGLVAGVDWDICHDGISYAWLIENGVAIEDYPLNETEFLLIKDSIQ